MKKDQHLFKKSKCLKIFKNLQIKSPNNHEYQVTKNNTTNEATLNQIPKSSQFLQMSSSEKQQATPSHDLAAMRLAKKSYQNLYFFYQNLQSFVRYSGDSANSK